MCSAPSATVQRKSLSCGRRGWFKKGETGKKGTAKREEKFYQDRADPRCHVRRRGGHPLVRLSEDLLHRMRGALRVGRRRRVVGIALPLRQARAREDRWYWRPKLTSGSISDAHAHTAAFETPRFTAVRTKRSSTGSGSSASL